MADIDIYLAGWKACIESLEDQSFEIPKEFNKCEREIAEQCFAEDYAFDHERQEL